MKKLNLVYVLLFAVIISCKESSKVVKTKKKVATIDSITVKKHLYTLASDDMEGRKSGTPGIEKAAKYIENEFKRIGLTTYDTLKNYRQTFTFTDKRSKKEITTPNIKKFERYKYHETGFCWGASLKAIINLMNIKGYIFIGSNRLNCNAFFVNKNLISKIGLKIPDTKNLSVYTNAKFQLKGSQDQNKNNEVEVYDIKTKKIKKFLEI